MDTDEGNSKSSVAQSNLSKEEDFSGGSWEFNMPIFDNNSNNNNNPNNNNANGRTMSMQMPCTPYHCKMSMHNQMARGGNWHCGGGQNHTMRRYGGGCRQMSYGNNCRRCNAMQCQGYHGMARAGAAQHQHQQQQQQQHQQQQHQQQSNYMNSFMPFGGGQTMPMGMPMGMPPHMGTPMGTPMGAQMVPPMGMPMSGPMNSPLTALGTGPGQDFMPPIMTLEQFNKLMQQEQQQLAQAQAQSQPHF